MISNKHLLKVAILGKILDEAHTQTSSSSLRDRERETKVKFKSIPLLTRIHNDNQ